MFSKTESRTLQYRCCLHCGRQSAAVGFAREMLTDATAPLMICVGKWSKVCIQVL